MAWTSPSTAVAGTVLTAATWNAQVRSNMQALLPLDAVAWSSYTPTLTQSGAVTKTVTYAKYTQFGKLVVFIVVLTCTGAGTGNNKILVGVPVTAAANFLSTPIGTGHIFDTSTAFLTPGLTQLESTTTAGMTDPSQQTAAASSTLGLTGTPFSVALASGDIVRLSGMYEAA